MQKILTLALAGIAFVALDYSYSPVKAALSTLNQHQKNQQPQAPMTPKTVSVWYYSPTGALIKSANITYTSLNDLRTSAENTFGVKKMKFLASSSGNYGVRCYQNVTNINQVNAIAGNPNSHLIFAPTQVPPNHGCRGIGEPTSATPFPVTVNYTPSGQQKGISTTILPILGKTMTMTQFRQVASKNLGTNTNMKFITTSQGYYGMRCYRVLPSQDMRNGIPTINYLYGLIANKALDTHIDLAPATFNLEGACPR